ncbi:MAG: VOC family protein [Burkholderiales bacterium]|nr:VOC family protein [Burkholderiales bacterium]
MGLSQIGQIALPVSDADVSEAFYGDTLGLPKLFRYEALVFFDCGGVRLMLDGSGERVTPTPGACHYFKVDGIETHYGALQSRGVAFGEPPHLIARLPDHELWMCFFRDPDGHLLALMEEKR